VLEDQYKTPTNAVDTIAASTDTILTFKLKNKACVEHVLTLTPIAGVTVTNEDFYSDRAVITFNNTNGGATDIEVLIEAKNYTQNYSKQFSLTDTDSEFNYGKSEFTYPENELIQTLNLADTLGDYLLGSYKDPFRDVTLQLNNAGNPALSLTDKIAVIDRYTEKRYNIVSKHTSYDGGLSMVYKGRVSSLKDFNLVDNLGNFIVDDLDNQVIVINTDTDSTYSLNDNLSNIIIDNQGREIAVRSN